MWPSIAIGSTGGYLLGKFMGGFSLKAILLSFILGLTLFIILSYLTAPIRDA